MQTVTHRLKLKEDAAAISDTDSTTSNGGVGSEGLNVGKTPAKRRMAIRTRFCDDFFEDCAGARGIKQARWNGRVGRVGCWLDILYPTAWSASGAFTGVEELRLR